MNNPKLKVLKVFPNPSSDKVTLLFDTSLDNTTLFLIHQQGYIINEFDVSNKKELDCDVSNLAQGQYQFVLVSKGYYSEMISFIKL